MIAAGSLSRTVTFQHRADTVAASGAVAEGWANFLTVRAEVRSPTADDVATGFGDAVRESIVLVVRWHPSPVSTGDRVVLDGKAYDIRQIVQIDRRVAWKIAAVAL